MREENKFDDFIKQQLSDYSPEVPSNIWQNIEAENNKRRPIAFWWDLLNNKAAIITAIILLAAFIALYTRKITTGKQEIAATKPIDQSIKKIISSAEKTPADSTGQVTINNKNTVATNKQGISATSINSGDSNSLGAPISIKKKNLAINLKEKLSKKATASQYLKDDLDLATASRIATAPIKPSGTKIKLAKPSVTGDDAENDVQIAIAESSLSNRKNKAYLKKAYTVHITNTGVSNDEDIWRSNKLLQANTLAGEKLSPQLLFDVQKITASSFAKNTHLLISPLTSPDRPEMEMNTAGDRRYFEFYAGPDYALRSFSDTANSVYLQKRKATTRILFSYSAGFRYTKVFNNGMSFKTGINFSQINEKFSYTAAHVVQNRFIVNSFTGDTTGNYAVTGTQYKSVYNHYRTVDVPLLVGYEMGNGKLHTNVNAGAIINCYSWQKGEILDANDKPVNITTGSTNSVYEFRNNIGIGFMAEVSFYYKLNGRFHLLAEPYYRYNITPVSKDNITLKQRYNTLGLRVGLRFDLP